MKPLTPRQPKPVATRPRGLTLVELLVVIVILTTLVTTAIPVLSPGGDDRRIREASRAINAYLAGAQARAIETGRPFGVAIRRLSSDTNSGDDNGLGVSISRVEVPPVYSGFDQSSVARICWNSNINQLQLQLVRYGDDTAPQIDRLPAGLDPDPFPPKFLRPGDRIEHSGFIYGLLPFITTGRNDRVLVGAVLDPINTEPVQTQTSFRVEYFTSAIRGNEDFSRPVTFTLVPLGESVNFDSQFDGQGFDMRTARISLYRQYQNSRQFSDVPMRAYHPVNDNQGNPLPSPETIAVMDPAPEAPYWSSPAPYRILRQPTPASGEPLELPAGVAIDLMASGFANGTALHYPGNYFDTNEDESIPLTDPVLIMFSPEGTLSNAYFPSPSNGLQQETLVTSSLSLLVGRRELIPAEPTPQALSRYSGNTRFALNEPIDLSTDLAGLDDEQEVELRNQYNWLNLDSRWVVIGAQSGTVSTIENSFVNPNLDEDGDGRSDVAQVMVAAGGNPMSINLAKQLVAARANAPRRVVQGGR